MRHLYQFVLSENNQIYLDYSRSCPISSCKSSEESPGQIKFLQGLDKIQLIRGYCKHNSVEFHPSFAECLPGNLVVVPHKGKVQGGVWNMSRSLSSCKCRGGNTLFLGECTPRGYPKEFNTSKSLQDPSVTSVQIMLNVKPLSNVSKMRSVIVKSLFIWRQSSPIRAV